MVAKRVVIIVSLGLVLLLSCWGIYRLRFGLNNVFSREHHFSDQRPFTEKVAIDLTMQAIAADGKDSSAMSPVELRPGDPEGHTKRFFSQNTLNPNRGYVLWGPTPDGTVEAGATTYLVRINKNGSDIRCRVLRAK